MSTTAFFFFFFQAEDGIRDHCVTGVQTCALPICGGGRRLRGHAVGARLHAQRRPPRGQAAPGRVSTLTRRLKDRYLTGHHRRVRGSSDHPTRHARLMLEEAARRRPGGGLLCDVGAGAEAAVASAAWPGRRVALDVVPGAGLDLIADGHALPLGDTTVAAVLLMEVLEHVPDPPRLLRECARVLAPGGHLCLTA